VAERDGDADRAVAAHAQIADVVEKDHAGGAGRIHGRAKQGADQHVGAPRLADDRPPQVVVNRAKPFTPLGQGPRTQVGAALQDDARGFAARVRIDDAEPMH
jgi:hypothetical protein